MKIRFIAALVLSLGLHGAILAGRWELAIPVPRIPDFSAMEITLVGDPSPVVNPRIPVSPASASATAAVEPTTAQGSDRDATEEAMIQARPDITNLNNPKPVYPHEARARGIEGRVLISVHVLADGRSTEVRLEQSSGHPLLDDSALQAVSRWRFIPAFRGAQAVDSRVIVPIRFRLDS